MKLTLQPTVTIDTIDGKIPARIWEGTTDTGTPVKAWIPVLQPQTADEGRLAEFDRELRKMPASRELVSFDIRMVL